MFRKLALFATLLATSLAFGQGAQRIGVAAVNSGGYLKALSGAAITVCNYNISLVCSVAVTVYQDPYLTIPNTIPFYADANGNYVYYTQPANLYLEQVCSPGVQCYTRPVILGGGASIVNVNGVNILAPNFNSAAPSPDAGDVALPFKAVGNNVIVEFPAGSPPVLGGVAPNAATFTNLTVTGTCTGCGTVDWAHPGTIGSGTPNTGAFTTLTSTGGALNGTIGATTPAAGTFTNVIGTTITAVTLNSSDGAANFGTIGATTPGNATFNNMTVLGTCTGCGTTDWANPGSLGSSTPNVVNSTEVKVNGSIVINSSGTLVTGAACNAGSPTSSTFCRGDGFWAPVSVSTQAANFGGSCSTGGGSYNTCTSTFTIPTPYSDTAYAAACSLLGPTGHPVIQSVAKTATTLAVTISNGTADGAVVSSASEVDCVFAHN